GRGLAPCATASPPTFSSLPRRRESSESSTSFQDPARECISSLFWTLVFHVAAKASYLFFLPYQLRLQAGFHFEKIGSGLPPGGAIQFFGGTNSLRWLFGNFRCQFKSLLP